MVFFKRKRGEQPATGNREVVTPESGGLRSRLKKTRQAISVLFSPGVKLDQGLLDDLEDHLIMTDMGVQAVSEVMDQIRTGVSAKQITTPEQLLDRVGEVVSEILDYSQQDLAIDKKPFVLLLVGVNGVGKTTTAARLARYYQLQGKSVMLAACDTFRAAAIEQLQNWGEKLNLPVIAQQHGSDAAAVAHDAYQAALARQVDLLIIDTAGRQHTHTSLMEQLGKVSRVLQKLDENAPHETTIVLDAGNGQNALSQVEHFNQITPLTGLVVTKLDGTARGGVVVALSKKYGLPVRFIGVGEAMDDLRAFDARDFARALLPEAFKSEAE